MATAHWRKPRVEPGVARADGQGWGALFDMDGVLVNSNPLHLRAWRELTERYGLKLTEEQLHYGLGGRLSSDIVEHFFGPLENREIDARALEKEIIFRRLAAEHLELVPGVDSLLGQLRAAGLGCSVATSAPHANLEMVLERFHLRGYFAGFVMAEDVTRGKPDPQVYQLAAERIGLAPECCAVFEDAVAGIEAGRRAGAVCIGITTTRRSEELTAAGAVLAVPDFTRLTAERVIQTLRTGAACCGEAGF